jgi:hypothetical protein
MEIGTTMRRFVLSAGRSTRAAAVAFAVLVLLAGGSAEAAPAPPTITNASLAVSIGTTLPPIAITQTGTVTPGVTRNGSNALVALTIPAPPPIVQTTSQIIPVTDPSAAPIRGIMATAQNDAAAFAGTPGVAWGGQMPLIGVNKVCLFATCTAAIANLIVPVSVVGEGGAALVTAAVNLTVLGAPWTSMTAQIGTVTKMGGITQMTAMGVSGTTVVDTVSLVTPVFVSTSIAPSAIVPVMGLFQFTITSPAPEPTTIAALGASIIALVTVGVSRRRKS